MNESDSDNPYSKDEIKEEYNSAAGASSEHEMVKWGSRDSMMNRFRLVLDQIDFSVISSWLDVGCGTGAFQQMVYSSQNNPPEGIAIDISDRLIEFAKKRVEHPNCEFRCVDFLSLEEMEVDLVTAIGVLQKTNISVNRFFEHSAEILSDEGKLLIDTKHLGWEKFEQPDFTPEASHRWFNVDDITAPAEEAGFEVLRVGGFLPRENRIVSTEESHSIFLIARKNS